MEYSTELQKWILVLRTPTNLKSWKSASLMSSLVGRDMTPLSLTSSTSLSLVSGLRLDGDCNSKVFSLAYQNQNLHYLSLQQLFYFNKKTGVIKKLTLFIK